MKFTNVLSSPVSIVRDGLREDSQLELMVRRFKRNRLGMAGLVIASVYFLIALVGPLLVTQDPSAMNPTERFLPPSLDHPFGTDRFGRDIFARTIVGARISLKVATAVVTFSSVVGVSLGLFAGYYGGKIDELIMRIVDVMFAFPSILLALVIIAILGPGLNKAIIALAIAYTPIMVRITRGSTLSVREEEYVMAAVSYGERNLGVMFRDVFPNIMSAVFVQATITFAFATLSEAGLSYLGLSAQPPTPTWGIMISMGQQTLEISPWGSLFPGLAIMFTVLGLTFLGVGLRDTLDPKTDTGQIGGL